MTTPSRLHLVRSFASPARVAPSAPLSRLFHVAEGISAASMTAHPLWLHLSESVRLSSPRCKALVALPGGSGSRYTGVHVIFGVPTIRLVDSSERTSRFRHGGMNNRLFLVATLIRRPAPYLLSCPRSSPRVRPLVTIPCDAAFLPSPRTLKDPAVNSHKSRGRERLSCWSRARVRSQRNLLPYAKEQLDVYEFGRQQ